MVLLYVIIIAICTLLASSSEIKMRAGGSCSSDFKICAPEGVTTDTLGPISARWGDLYSSIVDIVSEYGISVPVLATTDRIPLARRTEVLCCSNIADCVLVPGFNLAMCWDRFTTNVYFADGTYGAVVSGDFNTSDGVSINLVYGDYTMKNGTKGNIYNGQVSTSVKPNIATMPIPTPFTSKGVGSAIPATGLGTLASLSTVTTTIPETISALSTGPPITISSNSTLCDKCPAYNTIISGVTQAGGTRPGATSTYTTAIITPTMVGNVGTSNIQTLSSVLMVYIGTMMLASLVETLSEAI